MLGYIPQKWTFSEVIFIPKAGFQKSASNQPVFLHAQNHEATDGSTHEAVNWQIYIKKRSVETEYSPHHRKFFITAFIGIERAFSNIKSQANLNKLDHLGTFYPKIGCKSTRKLENYLPYYGILQ